MMAGFKTSHHRFARLMAAAVLLGVLAAPEVWAQRIRLLDLGRLSTTLDAEFDHRRYETGQSGRAVNEWSSLSSEGLRLKIPGSVYHPRFLSFNLQTRFELSHRRQRRGRADYDPGYDSHLLTYSGEGTFFRERRLFLRVAADRSRVRTNGDSVIDREDFIRTSSVETKLRSTKWPTLVRWQWRRNERGGVIAVTDRRFNLDARTAYNTPNHSARGQYGRSRIQTLGTTVDTRSQFLNLNDQIRGGQKTFLRSSLRWLKQDLDLDFESVASRVSVSRELGMGMTARTTGRFTRNTRGSRSQDILGVSGGGTHQLYQSLFTTATLGRTRSTYLLDRIDTKTLNLGVSYKKRIASTQLAYDLGLDRLQQNSESSPRSVGAFNLQLKFPLDGMIILPDRDIDGSTVAVADSLGREVYTEGLDYELVVQGRSLSLLRIPGGRINARSTVLVSYFYTFENDGASGRETVRNSLGLRVPFGFNLHVLRSRTHALEDGGVFTLGVQSGYRNEYAVSWSRRLFNAEWRYEKALQGTVYLEQGRVFGGLQGRLLKRNQAAVSFALSRSRVELDGPLISTRTVRSNLRHRLSRRFDVSINARYDERDLTEGQRNLFELGVRSRLLWGGNTVEARWGYQRRTGPVNGDFRDQRLYVRYERVLR